MLLNDDGTGPIHVFDSNLCMWLPASFLRWALLHNFRGELYPFLREKLEELGQLPTSTENLEALDDFNYAYAGNPMVRRIIHRDSARPG